jgi:hypothetical protein
VPRRSRQNSRSCARRTREDRGGYAAGRRGRLICARIFQARQVWQNRKRIAGGGESLSRIERIEGNVETELAARLGAAEAELADLKLRVSESLEREQRLIERVFEAEEKFYDALAMEHELRKHISHYVRFQKDLQSSRPWRMIQLLRRLVGREW